VSEVLYDHIAALRAQAPFRHATAVLILESNLPMIAETVRLQLEERRITNCCVMAQDPKRQRDGSGVMRTGTRTMRGKPEAMAHALSELLGLRALRFGSTFAVAHPSKVDVSVRSRIVTEMRSFKRRIRPPTATSRVKRFEATYEGIDGNGAPITTDMMDAIGFILLNHEIFRTSPAYQAHRTRGLDF
jgi:hypothetical protein